MVIMGIRIHVDYAFMHFHDVELLQNNFWESIFYTHAFTPWINMVVGFMYLFPESLHTLLYQLFFYVMSISGLLMFNGLLNELKINHWVSLVIVCFFSLTPAYIYFEHFLSYTFPSMVLLLGVTYTLLVALKHDTFKHWLLFFSLGVVLCFVRTTFHYIWLIAVVLGVLLVQKKISKNVTLAFTIPTVVLSGWYLKNLILFGFFGASSWAGFNLSFTTTHRLDFDEKKELVKKEKLSDLVLVPIYSGIESYHEYVDLNEKTGVAVLDEVGKGQVGWSNYNHRGFVSLSKLRMNDNLEYIKLFPLRYVKTVLLGVRQYFGPTTRWHPHDELKSPHIPVRRKIEFWENLYNQVLHEIPIGKVGLYVFVIFIIIIELFRYLRHVLKSNVYMLKDVLLVFSIMNVSYVTVLSCLVTFGELARYRFMVEPMIWILVVSFFVDNYGTVRKFLVLTIQKIRLIMTS